MHQRIERERERSEDDEEVSLSPENEMGGNVEWNSFYFHISSSQLFSTSFSYSNETCQRNFSLLSKLEFLFPPNLEMFP